MHVYLCGAMCMWTQVPTKSRGVRSPSSGVTGVCEQNDWYLYWYQTGVFCESSTCFYPLSPLSCPSYEFFILFQLQLISSTLPSYSALKLWGASWASHCLSSVGLYTQPQPLSAKVLSVRTSFHSLKYIINVPATSATRTHNTVIPYSHGLVTLFILQMSLHCHPVATQSSPKFHLKSYVLEPLLVLFSWKKIYAESFFLHVLWIIHMWRDKSWTGERENLPHTRPWATLWRGGMLSFLNGTLAIEYTGLPWFLVTSGLTFPSSTCWDHQPG